MRKIVGRLVRRMIPTRLLVRGCRGCDIPGYHDAHLSPLGWLWVATWGWGDVDDGGA